MKYSIDTPNEAKIKLFWKILIWKKLENSFWEYFDLRFQDLLPKWHRKKTFEYFMEIISESLRLQEIFLGEAPQAAAVWGGTLPSASFASCIPLLYILLRNLGWPPLNNPGSTPEKSHSWLDMKANMLGTFFLGRTLYRPTWCER